MISYKGMDFPTKKLSIIIDGEQQDITIATESLFNALGFFDGDEEQEIDDSIYFYVQEDEIDLSDEEIAKNCLDEEFELA